MTEWNYSRSLVKSSNERTGMLCDGNHLSYCHFKKSSVRIDGKTQHSAIPYYSRGYSTVLARPVSKCITYWICRWSAKECQANTSCVYTRGIFLRKHHHWRIPNTLWSSTSSNASDVAAVIAIHDNYLKYWLLRVLQIG